MKKISILLMLITSIALTYQSHRISKNSNLWFENRTIESLAGDDDYINGGTLPECTILCGLEEGHCWAGEFDTFVLLDIGNVLILQEIFIHTAKTNNMKYQPVMKIGKLVETNFK